MLNVKTSSRSPVLKASVAMAALAAVLTICLTQSANADWHGRGRDWHGHGWHRGGYAPGYVYAPPPPPVGYYPPAPVSPGINLVLPVHF